MARLPRMSLPEPGVYHVTSRGVARRAIYLDDDDHWLFTFLLRLAMRRWRWQVHAYCLMPNHFHLVLRCDLERLSRGMHLVNFRYATAFNQRYSRVGHLFQGRFSSYVIESDEYFEDACTYVFDNPVRAGLCATRDEWLWIGGEMLSVLRWNEGNARRNALPS